MIILSVKVGFWLIMIFSAFIGLTSPSMLVAWSAMELNLIILISLIMFMSFKKEAVLSLKIFVSQSFLGLVLLALLLLGLKGVYNSGWILLANILVLFKMGAFPFHLWVLDLTSQANWEGITILMTIQKFLPLFLLKSILSLKIYLLVLLSWVGIFSMASQAKSLKMIFIFSSLFFLNTLIVSQFFSESLWGIFLLSYSLLFMMIMFLKGGESLWMKSASPNSMDLSKLSWFFMILSVSGFPPFPMFFIKIIFILLLISVSDSYLLFTFLVSSLGMLYLYFSSSIWVLNSTVVTKYSFSPLYFSVNFFCMVVLSLAIIL